MNNSDTENTPKATEGAPQKLSPYQVFRLKQGVKYVNFAFVILIAAIVIGVGLGSLPDDMIKPKLGNAIVNIILILTFVMGFVGLIYSLIGIGTKRTNIVLCTIGMFLFPINLLIVIVVLRRATKKLIGAGYKVGLLGVKN